MLDDRVLVYATALEIGDELVLFAVDDQRGTGQAVARNDAGLADLLAARCAAQLGRPIVAANYRWADRPRRGGLDWIAFSAIENSLAALTAVAAGVSPTQWLGGTLRNAGSIADPATLGAKGRVVGDASYDEVISWLPDADLAWLEVDPRLWSTPAIQRLDALCRTLQIGLTLDVPDGSLASPLRVVLHEAMPMATLGRPIAVLQATVEPQRQVFAIGHSPL